MRGWEYELMIIYPDWSLCATVLPGNGVVRMEIQWKLTHTLSLTGERGGVALHPAVSQSQSAHHPWPLIHS